MSTPDNSKFIKNLGKGFLFSAALVGIVSVVINLADQASQDQIDQYNAETIMDTKNIEKTQQLDQKAVETVAEEKETEAATWKEKLKEKVDDAGGDGEEAVKDLETTTLENIGLGCPAAFEPTGTDENGNIVCPQGLVLKDNGCCTLDVATVTEGQKWANRGKAAGEFLLMAALEYVLIDMIVVPGITKAIGLQLAKQGAKIAAKEGAKQLGKKAATSAMGGPVGIFIFIVQMVGLVVDLMDPAGYSLHVGNKKVKETRDQSIFQTWDSVVNQPGGGSWPMLIGPSIAFPQENQIVVDSMMEKATVWLAENPGKEPPEIIEEINAAVAKIGENPDALDAMQTGAEDGAERFPEIKEFQDAIVKLNEWAYDQNFGNPNDRDKFIFDEMKKLLGDTEINVPQLNKTVKKKNMIKYFPDMSSDTRQGVTLNEAGASFWNSMNFEKLLTFRPTEGSDELPPFYAAWTDVYYEPGSTKATIEKPDLVKKTLPQKMCQAQPWAYELIQMCMKDKTGSGIKKFAKLNPAEFNVTYNASLGMCNYNETYCARVGMKFKDNDCYTTVDNKITEFIWGETTSKSVAQGGNAAVATITAPWGQGCPEGYDLKADPAGIASGTATVAASSVMATAAPVLAAGGGLVGGADGAKAGAAPVAVAKQGINLTRKKCYKKCDDGYRLQSNDSYICRTQCPPGSTQVTAARRCKKGLTERKLKVAENKVCEKGYDDRGWQVVEKRRCSMKPPPGGPWLRKFDSDNDLFFVKDYSGYTPYPALGVPTKMTKSNMITKSETCPPGYYEDLTVCRPDCPMTDSWGQSKPSPSKDFCEVTYSSSKDAKWEGGKWVGVRRDRKWVKRACPSGYTYSDGNKSCRQNTPSGFKYYQPVAWDKDSAYFVPDKKSGWKVGGTGKDKYFYKERSCKYNPWDPDKCPDPSHPKDYTDRPNIPGVNNQCCKPCPSGTTMASGTYFARCKTTDNNLKSRKVQWSSPSCPKGVKTYDGKKYGEGRDGVAWTVKDDSCGEPTPTGWELDTTGTDELWKLPSSNDRYNMGFFLKSAAGDRKQLEASNKDGSLLNKLGGGNKSKVCPEGTEKYGGSCFDKCPHGGKQKGLTCEIDLELGKDKIESTYGKLLCPEGYVKEGSVKCVQAPNDKEEVVTNLGISWAVQKPDEGWKRGGSLGSFYQYVPIDTYKRKGVPQMCDPNSDKPYLFSGLCYGDEGRALFPAEVKDCPDGQTPKPDAFGRLGDKYATCEPIDTANKEDVDKFMCPEGAYRYTAVPLSSFEEGEELKGKKIGNYTIPKGNYGQIPCVGMNENGVPLGGFMTPDKLVCNVVTGGSNNRKIKEYKGDKAKAIVPLDGCEGWKFGDDMAKGYDLKDIEGIDSSGKICKTTVPGKTWGRYGRTYADGKCAIKEITGGTLENTTYMN